MQQDYLQHGSDSNYFNRHFNNYEQTLDGNTYTFKRTVNINGTEYQEEVSSQPLMATRFILQMVLLRLITGK
ncbi:MAG: hypothetical protein H0A76_02135 [Candidatus Thiodubiliella endoseptemdiera]|uniref:Uncharacterized protein n=1 Tax=Candidatus Thiodubiliella endoseptemdiera TaxID=2738886 RepID=A0A853F2G7_9GAMM|nr:hypothetical protein [Candidatus Thiodubiliella endoseptemdiera]